MNTNIILFRAAVATSARRRARGNNNARPQMAARDVLVAIWRKNPTTGRLELRWEMSRSEATEEGASRGDLLCRAA
jgi:hypothetical protein